MMLSALPRSEYFYSCDMHFIKGELDEASFQPGYLEHLPCLVSATHSSLSRWRRGVPVRNTAGRSSSSSWEDSFERNASSGADLSTL